MNSYFEVQRHGSYNTQKRTHSSETRVRLTLSAAAKAAPPTCSSAFELKLPDNDGEAVIIASHKKLSWHQCERHKHTYSRVASDTFLFREAARLAPSTGPILLRLKLETESLLVGCNETTKKGLTQSLKD